MTSLAGTLDEKLVRIAAARGAEQVSGVLPLLEALNDEDAICAAIVAERLDSLLERLDVAGLERWIWTGLRLYAREPEQQRRYFRLEDPRAVEAMHCEAGAGDLAACMPSLTLLLHGLSGLSVHVQPRHQTALNGPALRPVLTASHLLLPDDYTTLDGSDHYRLYRAAVAHAVAHLCHSPRYQPTFTLKPMSIAVVSAVEDARVERLIMRDYPGMRGWFLEFLACGANPRELTFVSLIARMNLALMDADYQDDNYWVNKARSLFEEQADDLSNYAAFRRVGSILANDLGQMRVRFHPQQYVVPPPYRDDNSFLWDYGEFNGPPPESQELQVRGRRLEYRTDEAAARADPADGQPQPEIELGRTAYPEWDHRLSLSRADWCTVIDKIPAWQGRIPDAKAKSGDATLPLVALTRSRRLSRTRRLRRQWEGDDIDLNAAIEVMVDQRMDLSPDARLFVRSGREERVSSILVLLDLSESTNDCIGGALQSILDIEKMAALLLAQAVLHSHDRIAIHGFSSNTRAEVNYYRLLNFAAPLDERTAGMIRRVPGAYSTRMGAALRNATAHMAHEPGKHHSILVVTDGAPSDVDVFDADYLIEDARAAVLEARQSAVQTFGVVLDPKADTYARRIFGWRNYRIVDDPLLLPAHLSNLYTRLSLS
jgi:nitric oxide reductase NorD protein